MSVTLRQQLDRLRIPIRRSELDELFETERTLTRPERKLRDRFADERALDLGIPDAPRYREMFDELVAAYGRRFERVLRHPEDVTGRRWPLNSTELSELLESLGLGCSAQTIDRLADDELIAAPLRIGKGEERPLRVYFGRHFVEVAYWRHHGFRPAVERARLASFRSTLDHARQVFWDHHPSLGRRATSRRGSR